MEDYKIDFVNNTVYITRNFEKNLQDPSKEEYQFIQRLTADFPE